MSSIRRSSRLLTTLTSAKPTAQTLVPPYSHSQAVPEEPSPSLRPPYTHSHASPSTSHSGPAVQAKLKYTLLERDVQARNAQQEDEYRRWAVEMGEDEIKRVWEETLVSLAQAHQDGTQVPEIAFHELSQHLNDKSTVKDLRRIGLVVVRDVIADADAQAAGEELRAYTQARAGHVMAALTGLEAKYIRADTLSSIATASASSKTAFNMTRPWSSPNTLSANFALSASRPGTYSTVPSLSAARYAALRPLFKPRQSLISFYNKEGYLDSSNWSLSPASSLSCTASHDLPHLRNTVDLPALAPGDMVYWHAALPIIPSKSEIGSTDFLPLHPLPASSESEFAVSAQRDAYEKGVPPPHVLVEGTVALEEGGKRDALASNGGKTAMGY